MANRGGAAGGPHLPSAATGSDNGLADAAFDRAYAIESSEHMVDKARFFSFRKAGGC